MFESERKNLKKLKAELVCLASNTSNQTHGLSADMFLSKELATVELDQIFHREWSCVGREDDVPNVGDFITFVVGNQPIIVVRLEDKTIRAMSNVCRHRMMRLIQGNGNTRQFSCPYHGWTYNIDGNLAGAPHMSCNLNFNKEKFRLPALRCETWHGWIYVSLSDDATPIVDRLGKLDPIVRPYGMKDYRTVFVEDLEWDTNWKILCQNFMEGYHLPIAHRSTVGRNFSVAETRFDSDGPSESFTYQYFLKPNDVDFGVAHPMNKRLTDSMRQTSVMPTIFPSHMYVLAPDHLWYLSLQPNGIGKVRIRYGAALAPEVIKHAKDKSALVSKFRELLDKTQEEDRFLVETIFQNIKGPMALPGPLSWLEREVHEFTQYLAREIA